MLKGKNMDRYRTNCGGYMRMPSAPKPVKSAKPAESCSRIDHKDNIYHHADELPLTMAYVPMQTFKTTFPLGKALHVGTIFPELCKPFVGKRGIKC